MAKSRYPQPIVVKRVRIVDAPHRVAQWKVAYADFVTAMMAFFLLLWIVNATTPIQKTAIAEYFTPTIGLKDAEGVGLKGGARSSQEGKSDNDLVPVGFVAGQVKKGSAEDVINADISEENQDTELAQQMVKPEDSFVEEGDFRSTMVGLNQALRDLRDQKIKRSVEVQDTPEGLKIDLIDDPKNPLFYPGNDELTTAGKKTLDTIVRVVKLTPNLITIHAHMESGHRIPRADYDIWELSSDRANAVRRYLVTINIEHERISRVIGEADKAPLMPRSPSSLRNRRITILLVRDAYAKVVPDAKLAPKKVEEKEKPKFETPNLHLGIAPKIGE